MVNLIFLEVALVNIVSGHTEGLGKGDEKMKEVDHFDASVLFVDLLVFGPPFPRKAIDEFGQFLGHGAGVVEGPLGFVIGGKGGEIDSDFFIKEVLHAEDLVKFVGGSHEELVAGGR